MNITEQDCINGREAVRRDGVFVKLRDWVSDSPWSVWGDDISSRRPDGLASPGSENPADLLCWREDLVHEVPGFTVEDAQAVLDGDCEGVLDGFVWEESPQGIGYWSSVYNAMCGGEPLHAEARDILLASIAVAKREAAANLAKTPETPLVPVVVSVPLDRIAELHGFAAGLCGEGA